MTKQEKIQMVIEATGGCWHSPNFKDGLCSCGNSVMYSACPVANPNPDSVDDLLRLAEKLGYDTRVSCTHALDPKYDAIVITERTTKHLATMGAPAEALLEALWQAIKGVELDNTP